MTETTHIGIGSNDDDCSSCGGSLEEHDQDDEGLYYCEPELQNEQQRGPELEVQQQVDQESAD